MKTPKRLLLLGLSCALLLVSLVALAQVVREPPLSRATVQPLEAPAQTTASAIRSEAAEPIEPEGTGRLAGYVLRAILAWDEGVKVSGARSRLAAISRDIAWVSLEQARVWKGSDGAREAILLARLAWFESRLRDYVDDGRCQSWATACMTYANGVPYCDFAKLPKGEPRDSMMLGTCDGGRAVSLWQIQFGDRGILLTTGVMTSAHDEGAVDRVAAWHAPMRMTATDEEIARSLSWHRRQAARAALAIARRSIQQGAGLRWYVGGEGPDRASMAAQRLDSAEAWSRAHPFKP